MNFKTREIKALALTQLKEMTILSQEAENKETGDKNGDKTTKTPTSEKDISSIRQRFTRIYAKGRKKETLPNN